MKINNKNRLILFAILTVIPSFLKAAGKTKTHPLWAWTLNNIAFIIAGAVLLGVFFSMLNLMESIMKDKQREFLRAHGIEPTPPAPGDNESIFSKLYKKATLLVPVEKEADIQLDHDYDGIKELDNSLPPWWLYGFYLSIIVAIGYLYVYHYSDFGLSQQEEYKVAIHEGERQKAEFAARQVINIDENNLVALEDQKSLEIGIRAFKMNCAACHGQEGQGGVGPNLTDEFWIHGGSTSHIYKTIKNGVPEKGMIAWKAQMQPSTIHKLASYIQTLQGTNPPNPKAPQGEPYNGEDEDVGMVTDK